MKDELKKSNEAEPIPNWRPLHSRFMANCHNEESLQNLLLCTSFYRKSFNILLCNGEISYNGNFQQFEDISVVVCHVDVS